MAQALVRDLDDDVYERLKAIAAENNRSLEAELRTILTTASRQVTAATARRKRRQCGSGSQRRAGFIRICRVDPRGPRPMSGSPPPGFLREGDPASRPASTSPSPTPGPMPSNPIPVVVDASVGVKWYVPEVHSRDAERLLDARFVRHVPSHFAIEVAGTIWKKIVQRGELTEDEGRAVRALVARVPLEVHPSGGLVDAAFEIALSTERSIYDSLYIALAERQGCRVYTADRRLYNATRGGPLAHRLAWIEDIP